MGICFGSIEFVAVGQRKGSIIQGFECQMGGSLMSEDCHDSNNQSTGGRLPFQPMERKKWTCDICGAVESAWDSEVLALRKLWHNNREHKSKPTTTTSVVLVDWSELKLTVLDREFLRQCGIKT